MSLILDQCFNSPPGREMDYGDRIGWENFRIIHQGKAIAGGLAILKMGQWYGSQCVPMAGIGGVGILPEYRGSGAAIALLQHTLAELYAEGFAISMLYPATQHPYRKVGYEQAGSFCRWQMPTDAIQIRERSLPIQAVDPLHFEAFSDIYSQQAKSTNGYLKRNQAIWKEIIEAPSKEVINYAYLIGNSASPSGYIIFSQKPSDNYGFTIRIRDLVLLNVDAVKRFWTFVADHRSQIKKVEWRQSMVDSLTFLLPEQTATVIDAMRWMLRIINVSKALELRGYAQDTEAELHMEIEDELLNENHGRFVLKVAKGKGEVSKGGKGDLKLHVRGLSPLYTGLFSPLQLKLVGQLEASDAVLSNATKIFAGSQPWTPDFF